jgi:hypothetical protein
MGEGGISLLAKMAAPGLGRLLLHRRLLCDQYVDRFVIAITFRRPRTERAHLLHRLIHTDPGHRLMRFLGDHADQHQAMG